MAVLFTALLGVSSGILGYFIYSYRQGTYLDESRVAISASTYELILYLGIAAIFFMSLVAVISFFISIFVVGRINDISNTAKDIIETGDLSRRVEIDKRWDDLGNLAFVLNNMFARIEGLMQDVRQVSDNIAHDLRTPLTRLRNQLEEVKKESSAPDKIDKMISEADGLLQTFSALLRITNIEKGTRHSKFTNVSLDKILKDVIELYEPIAEEKNIKITKELKPVEYNGDKDLLFQAFANILDNSIKFTPQNGEIKVSLSNGKDINIQIADTGIGVSNLDKKKVFDRFYRSDSSRNSPGSGLGLSLVQAVINLHKGSIELLDNEPFGLVVSVTL